MKLFKYSGAALLGVALLMTQSVNFSTDNNLVWVSLNFNGAEASEDREGCASYLPTNSESPVLWLVLVLISKKKIWGMVMFCKIFKLFVKGSAVAALMLLGSVQITVNTQAMQGWVSAFF